MRYPYLFLALGDLVSYLYWNLDLVTLVIGGLPKDYIICHITCSIDRLLGNLAGE